MEAKQRRNRRVLIVDDQQEIHDDFSEVLDLDSPLARSDEVAASFNSSERPASVPKFDLLHATSGQEAVNIVDEFRASNRPIAVAYVDIRMPPGIDGVETIRRIREIDSQIEIVIMTAYADRPLSKILDDMSMLHKLLYVRKPFAREEIQQITISLVEKWNVEQAFRRKQRQLTVDHRRLQAVLNATEDAMAMYDTNDRLLFANKRCEKLFNMAASELKLASAASLLSRLKKLPATGGAEGLYLMGDGKARAGKDPPDLAKAQRLYRLFTTHVRDDRNDRIGRLYVYRDVSREIEIDRMKAEVRRLRAEVGETYSFSGIVGASRKMRHLYAQLKQVAASDITALVEGESGTGKELVVKSIHFNSLRKSGPLVVINCVAIPESLIESELFGHEKGAFTGATARRTGAFERARGGTVFLDEIGDMQLSLQAKLLRVLQEREIQRVGGTASVPVNVRVIAATNKKLEAEVKAGNFREDLFYRISAFPITIPPLRERRDDIALLAEHFLKKHADRLDKTIDGISVAASRLLLKYDWPGNVRELQNVIERAVLLETNDVLQAENLPEKLSPPAAIRTGPMSSTELLPLADVERWAVVRALEVSANNVSEAARILGLNRTTLYRKMKKHDLAASS